jgi:hypothetical protein
MSPDVQVNLQLHFNFLTFLLMSTVTPLKKLSHYEHLRSYLFGRLITGKL